MNKSLDLHRLRVVVHFIDRVQKSESCPARSRSCYKLSSPSLLEIDLFKAAIKLDRNLTLNTEGGPPEVWRDLSTLSTKVDGGDGPCD